MGGGALTATLLADGTFGASRAADALESVTTRLTSVLPTCGAAATGTSVALRGVRLGAAVSRGELQLRLTLPDRTSSTLSAVFVSERKITCTLPPSARPGLATIELLHSGPPPAKRGASSPPKAAVAAANATEKSAPAVTAVADGGGVSLDGVGAESAPLVASRSEGGGTPEACTFRYLGPYAIHKLRPFSGPVGGGTAVRVLGTGFVGTGELAVCVRMRGVERRVPAAFISEGEVRFLAPTFGLETGDAKVTLSLNGQDHAATELVYTYQASLLSTCAIM